MYRNSYDLLVIGAGLTGLAAAIRAAADGLSVGVVEQKESAGGFARQLSRVRSIPGFLVGISGSELVDRSVSRASAFGAELRLECQIVVLRPGGGGLFAISNDGSELRSTAMIVASGATFDLPVIQGFRELLGSGIHMDPPSDTTPWETADGDAFITGDPNEVRRALGHLRAVHRSVTLLGCPAPRVDLPLAGFAGGRVRLRAAWEVMEALGVGSLEALVLRNARSGRIAIREASDLYLLHALSPGTDWLANILDRTADGFLPTGDALSAIAGEGRWPLDRKRYPHETIVPGLFAAGCARLGAACDIRSAATEGVSAAREAGEYVRSIKLSRTRILRTPGALRPVDEEISR